jgi:toxin HigB-1
MLGKINSAGDLRDLNSPGHRLHKHKGKENIYSIDVSGNYRILFRWYDGHAWDVNYEDPH